MRDGESKDNFGIYPTYHINNTYMLLLCPFEENASHVLAAYCRMNKVINWLIDVLYSIKIPFTRPATTMDANRIVYDID